MQRCGMAMMSQDIVVSMNSILQVGYNDNSDTAGGSLRASHTLGGTRCSPSVRPSSSEGSLCVKGIIWCKPYDHIYLVPLCTLAILCRRAHWCTRPIKEGLHTTVITHCFIGL